jgi:hypothetical protein
MYSKKGKRVKRQGSHMDFKWDEGVFAILICLANNVMFEYTRAGGQKVRVELMKGDIVIFDSRLEHNGPEYGVPGADDNLFLRYHSYCEFITQHETSDKLIIHLKEVSGWLPCVVSLSFIFLTC